jgi:hypothetical protein
MHYQLGLSFGRCTSLLGHLGINVTAGALCQAAQKTGTALVPVHADLVQRANDAEVTVMDETGVRHEVARMSSYVKWEGRLMTVT